jgi:hypothetical protein
VILQLVLALASPAVKSVENDTTAPATDETSKSAFTGAAAQVCPATSTSRSFMPTTMLASALDRSTELAASFTEATAELISNGATNCGTPEHDVALQPEYENDPPSVSQAAAADPK